MMRCMMRRDGMYRKSGMVRIFIVTFLLSITGTSLAFIFRLLLSLLMILISFCIPMRVFRSLSLASLYSGKRYSSESKSLGMSSMNYCAYC